MATSLNYIPFAKASGLINTFTFDVANYKNGSFKTSIDAEIKLCYFDEQSNPYPVFPDKISIIITNLANTPIMTRESNPDKITMTNTIKFNQNIIHINCNLEDIEYDIKLIVKFQSSQFTNSYMIENYDSSKITIEYLDSTDYDIFSFIIQLNYLKNNDSLLDEPLVYIAIALPVFFISACIVILKVQNHPSQKAQKRSYKEKAQIQSQKSNKVARKQFENLEIKRSLTPKIQKKVLKPNLDEDEIIAEKPHNDFLRSSQIIKNKQFKEMIDNIAPESYLQHFEANQPNLESDDEKINEESNQEESDVDSIYYM